MTEPASAEPETRPAKDSAVQNLLSVVAAVGVPVTVVGALMFYFGWARSDAQAKLINLRESLYGYASQDYILRGIQPVFMPLLWMGIVGVALLGLHQAIQARLGNPRWRPVLVHAGRIAFVVGMVVAGGALLASMVYGRAVLWQAAMAAPARVLVALLPIAAGPLVAPLLIAAGTAVAGYSLWLVRAATPVSLRRTLPMGQRLLRAGLIAWIIGLAIFWWVGRYAEDQGKASASTMAEQLHSMPRATAYSAAPLGISALGVQEHRISVDPPLWRTTGLRLIGRAGGRMFLLHDGWTPEQGSVLVVPDDGRVVWQFSR